MTTQKGSILPLILTIAALGLFFYFIKLNYSSYPTTTTQDNAKTIPKYPAAKTWGIENAKKICLFNFGGCANQPSRIIFTTQDTWAKIYGYFRTNLDAKGWSTNSQIYTSIPTNIIFNKNLKNAYCEAALSLEETGFFKKNRDPNLNTYIFIVKCTPII